MIVSSLRVTLGVLLLTSAHLQAKGLDSLQADSPAPVEAPAPVVAPAVPPATGETPLPSAPPATTPAVAAGPVVSTQTPVPPGLQNFYVASGLSWVNLTAKNGGWHSSTTGDLEAGYKLVRLMDKFDLFGTFRYRPVAVDIVSNQRAYRGIVESYLFGAKAHLALNSKLTLNTSAELGLVDTHINSVDSLLDIDQDLENSGVDLAIGAGVSYLVLEKIGVGSRIAFGTGAYTSFQIGLDIRFLL